MKNVMLKCFIICGTMAILVFPVVGIVTFFLPVNIGKETSNLQLSNESISDEINDEKTIDEESVPLASSNAPLSDQINVDGKEIVYGKTVKENYAAHKDRIEKQELVFEVINENENATHYYDYNELLKDVEDDMIYKKEYILEKGILIKYIYKKIK